VTLGHDIWLSSVDVARRVLNPDMPLNPGILRVDTQDEDESDITAAFSAHGITITPGELVVDFDGSLTMYVHCLDMEESAKHAVAAQARRLKLLRRIIGRG
jgi:multicomponent Na+:H+ antiporter subunit E